MDKEIYTAEKLMFSIKLYGSKKIKVSMKLNLKGKKCKYKIINVKCTIFIKTIANVENNCRVHKKIKKGAFIIKCKIKENINAVFVYCSCLISVNTIYKNLRKH